MPTMLLQMAGFPHSSWLNNTPFYIDATTSLSIHQSMDTIHDCFHVLATTNNAAVDMAVQISLQVTVSISFVYSLRSNTAGSYDRFIFNFLGTSTLFSTAAAPIHNPTNSALKFSLLHIHASTRYLFSFEDKTYHVVYPAPQQV